jgi:GTP-binding protein
VKISSAEFIKSETNIRNFPTDGLPEIVLIGKSNVGKSSFINAMLRRKKLARTSSQPGHTRTANLYKINQAFYFVDMPGYGYAKVSKTDRTDFSKIIDTYLNDREADFLVFFLVDFRHMPTENDLAMYRKIQKVGIHPVMIFTKADKIGNNQKAFHLKDIKKAFSLDEDDVAFLFSVYQESSQEPIWDFVKNVFELDQ